MLVFDIYVGKLYLCCPILTQLAFKLEFRALDLPQLYFNLMV